MTNEDLREGIWSGLISGVIFIVLLMSLFTIFTGISGWAPINMIAGIVMGRNLIMPLHEIDPGTAVTGFLIHFVLSAIYGTVLVSLIRKTGKIAAVFIGLVFGLALYLINFYGFTEIFPWFAEARNWATILTHLIFGTSAAYTYKVFQEKYQCETC